MALFKSQVLTQASGSVGGMTYTRTRSGLTIRARSVPVQPTSVFRAAVQSSLATLSVLWSSTLTDAERLAWTTYAANSPYVNKLGDPLILSGQQMFIACNTPRLQAGIATVTTAPATFGLGSLQPLTVTMTAPVTGSVTFDPADAWNLDGGALLVYFSNAVPIARNFFKGPYRIATPLIGDTTTPLTPPGTATVNQPILTGQKFFWRAFATNPDGRLTNVYSGSGIAV